MSGLNGLGDAAASRGRFASRRADGLGKLLRPEALVVSPSSPPHQPSQSHDPLPRRVELLFRYRVADRASSASSRLRRRSVSALASRSTVSRDAIGSRSPAPMNTDVVERSGSASGSKGSIGLRSTAPRTTRTTTQQQARGDVRAIGEARRDDAVAIEPIGLRRGVDELRQLVRARARSSRSNTPGASRRKKRGAPPSSTLPRGLRMPAPGSSERPSGIRSSSSPPVPCSRSKRGARRALGARGGRADSDARSRARHRSRLPVRSWWRRSPRPSRGRVGGSVEAPLRSAARFGSYCGGQHEPLAELLDGLVDRESGRRGGELVQHAARLTKVDGVKVVPVDHRRRVQPGARSPARAPRARPDRPPPRTRRGARSPRPSRRA